MKSRLLILSLSALTLTSCLNVEHYVRQDVAYVRVLDTEGNSLLDPEDTTLFDGSVCLEVGGVSYPLQLTDLETKSLEHIPENTEDPFRGLYLGYDWDDELCLCFDVYYPNIDQVIDYTIIWKDGSKYVLTKHSKRDILHIRADDYTDWYLDGEGVTPPFDIVVK